MVLSTVSVILLLNSSNEQKAGRAMRESARAFYATDAGLNMVVAEWESLRYDTLMATPGDSVDLGSQTLDNGATYRAQLQRIDDGSGDQVFSVTVRGGTSAGSSSLVSSILKWRKVWPIGDPMAAIFAGVGLRKNSSAGMNTGVDACTTDSIAGLVVPEDELEYSGDPTEVFDGAPPVLELDEDDVVQSMNDSGLDWAAILAGNFDYVISDEAQFPDFSTLPADYYPSILFTGSRMDVNASFNGRGMLVVVEELRINGGFEWDGAIMVGNFFQSNGQMTITGMMASGLDLQLGRDPSTMKLSAIGPGLAQMTYNSCVLAKAVGAVGAGSKQLVVLDGTWAAGW